MAPGESVAVSAEQEPPADHGIADVGNGRLSVARHLGRTQRDELPFSTRQLSQLDEALTLCTRATGLSFSVYLGALGAESRARAEELLAASGAGAGDAVLIAVAPGERVVEVVTGVHAQRRVSDRAARLAVMAMVASFKDSDLIGGLLSALRMLSDQAGPRPR
ncbi:MAG: DUF5130 family protein [Mycobacteriaceae bacterium]